MIKYLTAIILATSFVFGSVAQAAEQKIGAISVPYVISQIPQTKAAEAKIKKALASKEKALDKLQSEAQALGEKLNNPTTSAEQRAKIQRELQVLQTELQVKFSEYREEQQKLAAKENQSIIKLIEKALEQVAKQNNIDIVFKAESIAYSKSQTVDLSDEVIKIVAKSK